MRVNWPRILGLAFVVGVFVLLLYSASTPFPLFQYGEAPMELTPSREANTALCRALWGWRAMDLLAQAFLLFAAAACCVAVLWEEMRR